MSIRNSLLAALSVLVLAPACEKEGKDSDSSDSAATESGSASEGGSAETGGSDPTEGGSASNSASASGSASESASASATGDEGGQTCEGDWTLGSVPFSGDPTLGQACDDPNVPKNCADGTYIKFADTNECICIALCSSLGVSAGQNCTENGTWVCAKIEATNASMNSATACVNAGWNLCTAGGSSSGGESASGGDSASSGDSASASESDSASASASESDSASASDGDESACAPAGSECSFGDDCCSGDCDFDVCG